MKPFHFQKFSLHQSKEVFRVGTDGVLLGALSNMEGKNSILEIGCGTGLISLMLTQRNVKAKILAIDISKEAVALAKINFSSSPFFDRLEAAVADFNDFKSNCLFDAIVCNPPYFEANKSVKDTLARQKVALNFVQLIVNASKFLIDHGIFAVIIPAEYCDEFIRISLSNQLYLQRKIEIFGIEGGSLKRVILEFSKIETKTEFLQFTIEKSPRMYSDAYLKITKDFHVFGKDSTQKAP